jgi:carbonic anhydrase
MLIHMLKRVCHQSVPCCNFSAISTTAFRQQKTTSNTLRHTHTPLTVTSTTITGGKKPSFFHSNSDCCPPCSSTTFGTKNPVKFNVSSDLKQALNQSREAAAAAAAAAASTTHSQPATTTTAVSASGHSGARPVSGMQRANIFTAKAVPYSDDGAADPKYRELFTNNRAWVQQMQSEDPDFFTNLATGQAPKFLFIGCSDSRIPAESITGMGPGNMFVHRNIANLVLSNDMSVLSVLQFAVEKLQVDHILVVGHYGCGGVKAAMEGQDTGLLDNWLRNVRDVQRLHLDELRSISDPEARFRRTVELNVQEQCINVLKNGIVQRARSANRKDRGTGQPYPAIHALVFDIGEGILKELPVNFQKYADKYSDIYRLY